MLVWEEVCATQCSGVQTEGEGRGVREIQPSMEPFQGAILHYFEHLKLLGTPGGYEIC